MATDCCWRKRIFNFPFFLLPSSLSSLFPWLPSRWRRTDRRDLVNGEMSCFFSPLPLSHSSSGLATFISNQRISENLSLRSLCRKMERRTSFFPFFPLFFLFPYLSCFLLVSNCFQDMRKWWRKIFPVPLLRLPSPLPLFCQVFTYFSFRLHEYGRKSETFFSLLPPFCLLFSRPPALDIFLCPGYDPWK